MKPTVLYHGSPNTLIGDELIPFKAKGLDKDDSQEGVYATRVKEFAIIRAILSSIKKGNGSFIKPIDNKFYGFLQQGWPEVEEVYVYHLNPYNFKNIPENSHQYIAFEKVKPLEVEVIKTEDYIHLIKKII